MKTYKTQLGISLAFLIGLFGFLYFFSGVFGGTQVALTLRTNPDLNQGLVAHYTFDEELEQGTFEFGTGGATTTDITSNDDIAYAITTGPEGFVYITGQCNGCQDGSGLAHYTHKISPIDGKVIWSTTTEAGPRAYGITIDPAGDVYVTGYCNGCGSQGVFAHYTYKLNASDGSFYWATTTDPTTGNDQGEAIASDAAGYIYVTGDCNGCGSNGNNSHYMFKIDPDDGSLVWATTTDPSPNGDESYSITTDPSGFVYVGGHCNGCGWAGSGAHYAYKVDPVDGDMLWATTTADSLGNDRIIGITTDSSGNVYVTGFVDQAMCGGSGSDNCHFTAKLNPSSGDALWSTTTDPTSNDDEAEAIAADVSGNIYVTGSCNGCGVNGGEAFYTYKIDGNDGSMLWATTTDPSTGDDRGEGITVDNEGYVHVTGYADNEACGGSGTDQCHYTFKIDPDDGLMVDTTTADAAVSLGKTVSGKLGQGVAFDGVDDYFRISNTSLFNLAAASDYTWAFWIKPGSFEEFNTAYIQVENATTDWFGIIPHTTSNTSFGPVTAGISATWTSGGSNYTTRNTTDNVLRLGEWHHVVVKYDASQAQVSRLQIYVDGIDQTNTSDDRSSGTLVDLNDWGSVLIGWSEVAGEQYNGTIDDFRFYNRLLSQSEITRLYQLGATTKIAKTLRTNPDLENGLVAHYTFDADFETGSYEFATEGVTTTDATNQNENGEAISVDEDYIYVSGLLDRCSGSTQCWVHTKFEKATGNLATGFGDNGATSTFTTRSANEGPWDNFVDDEHLYAVGYAASGCSLGGECGRIEKHDKITGDFVSDFGVGGFVEFDLSAGDDTVWEIAVDDAYIYVVGVQGSGCPSGGECGFYQKRDKNSGTLIKAFGDDGTLVTDPSTGDDYFRTLVIDDQYIYGGGGVDQNHSLCASTECFYIEKRDKHSGDLIQSFGDGGATTTNLTNGEDTIYEMVLDGQYIFAAGHGNGGGGNGYRGNAVVKYNKNTGNADNGFDGEGIVAVNSSEGEDRLFAIVQDDTYIYTGGHCTISNNCWHYQKIHKTTGAFDTNFGDGGSTTVDHSSSNDRALGVAVDGEFLYITGHKNDCSVGGTCAELRKVFKSNGWLASTTASSTQHLIGGPDYRKGVLGQAIEFDGVDDYILVSDSVETRFGTGDFTVSAWIKHSPMSALPHRGIYSKGDGAGSTAGTLSFYIAYQSGAFLRTIIHDDQQAITGVSNPADGTWHHVVLVREGSEGRMYMDTNLEVSSTTYFAGIDLNSSDDAQIGYRSTGRYFDGSIDDVRLYNKALSVDEINRLYGLGATTKIAKTINTNPTLQDGLLLHWTFDGVDVDRSSSTSEVADKSGNGYDGNWLEHATTTVPGRIGQGIYFDGIDDNVVSSPITLTSNYTTAFWFKSPDPSGTAEITQPFAWNSTLDYGIAFSWDHTNNTFREAWSHYDTTWRALEYSTSLQANTWYHLALTYDGTTARAYLNGVEEDTSAVGAVTDSGTEHVSAGSAGGGTSEYSEGTIDDVRVYNRALSAEEILRLYQLGGN